MTKDDEVVPDSQDEAELHLSESDLSPPPELPSLTNAAIPSIQTSSSFVLPRPMSAKKPTPLRTAPSSISQFTTSTEITAEPTGVSAISAFTTTSSSGSRPRPKPRPAYSAAKATSTSKNFITSPAVSTISNAPYALPPPQATFSSDISERIKARRGCPTVIPISPLAQKPVLARTKPKKAAYAEVIDITSDDDFTPRHARSSSSKHSPKLRSPDPLNLSAPTRISRSVASELVMSPSALKRKRDSVDLPTKLGLVPEGPRSLTVCFPADDSVFEAPPLKKTKKKSKAAGADTGTGLPKPKKVKAKDKAPGATSKEPKKAPSKPKAKAQEKEQFKSREFIEDSDDELGLGDGDSAGRTENLKPHVVPPDIATQIATPSHKPNSAESRPEPETPREVNTEKPTNEASRKRSKNTKRKKAEETQDEQSTNIESFQSPPKKMKPVETITEKKLSSPSKQRSRVGDRLAETKSVSPKDPVEERPRTPEDHVDVSYPKKKKKGSRKIIEDDEEQSDHGEAKENKPPVTKTVNAPAPASTVKAPSPHFPINPPSSISKPSYAHPPKNRPLSSILQRVNGSSPRLRASPSVSRSLLTRIAPLHPNRRTPPPPPPPRIIPKKTKKELEREEKWEEELQETEGWCEMGEEERNVLRRAKRDWELGLCEE